MNINLPVRLSEIMNELELIEFMSWLLASCDDEFMKTYENGIHYCVGALSMELSHKICGTDKENERILNEVRKGVNKWKKTNGNSHRLKSSGC